MKKSMVAMVYMMCVASLPMYAQWGSLGDRIANGLSNKAQQKIETEADNAADRVYDKTKESVKEGAKSSKTKNSSASDDNQSQSRNDEPVSKGSNNTAPSIQPTAALKAYNNYDFVPGDTILFEDQFADDQDGEFPAHWKLIQGQGVINKVDNESVFAFDQTSIVTPLMKKTSYLTGQYTIEFDFYVSSSYGGLNQINLLFDDKLVEWTEGKMYLNTNEQSYTLVYPGGQLVKSLTDETARDNYYNKWHHLAIAVKDKQMKVYLDQNRILTIPDCNYKAGAAGLSINGIDGSGLIGFKNFRLAKGGGMNMLGKKFTDTRIVTHGINFDYNKATIKPESMGTLNMIVQVMKDNPDLKFEVGGHTDSDGDDGYNLKLSQQRADAVKSQLIIMGVAAERLTSKGYGESKPIAPNSTEEGKANNRRVEFVKI